MSTLIRSAFAAIALIGTVSVVSAAPYRTDAYAQSDSFNSGPIADFNKSTHKSD